MNHILEMTKALNELGFTPEFVTQKADANDPEGYLVSVNFSTPEAKRLIEFLRQTKGKINGEA